MRQQRCCGEISYSLAPPQVGSIDDARACRLSPRAGSGGRRVGRAEHVHEGGIALISQAAEAQQVAVCELHRRLHVCLPWQSDMIECNAVDKRAQTLADKHEGERARLADTYYSVLAMNARLTLVLRVEQRERAVRRAADCKDLAWHRW